MYFLWYKYMASTNLPAHVTQDFDKLGKLLKDCRLRRKLSESEAGKLIGVGRSTIRRIESGCTKVSVGTLESLKVLYGIYTPVYEDALMENDTIGLAILNEKTSRKTLDTDF